MTGDSEGVNSEFPEWILSPRGAVHPFCNSLSLPLFLSL